MDEHLTVEEAAAKLKFSTATVRRLLRTGELGGVKFGPRQWRVPESSLKAYMEGGVKPAAPKEN